LKPEKYVNTVAFSANGKMVASAGGGDSVQLCDAQKGELLLILQCLGSGTRSIAFAPDDQMMAAGGKDVKVRLGDVRIGNFCPPRITRDADGRLGAIRAAVFSE